MKKNILKDKSFLFAVRMVNLNKYLRRRQNEHILFNQLIRCGTAIGALIREAEFAENSRDFIHKLKIALKEANESRFWIDLLYNTDYITEHMFLSIVKDCDELIKLLTASINTMRQRTT